MNPTARLSSISFYCIGVAHPITPDEPLPSLPQIPRGALVFIEGRAPIWRYRVAFHMLHGSPAGAIAVYDSGEWSWPRNRPEFHEGQIVDVSPPIAKTDSGLGREPEGLN